jgi:hypothetical protein
MTVEHALSCRVGGRVHIRHDDVADKFRVLYTAAFSPGHVRREPRIRTGISRQVRVAAEADVATNPATQTAPNQSRNPYITTPHQSSEERGDASCYAFWQRGCNCIFDVRIMDTEARSHRNKDPAKVLELQEKEKKGKYLQTCHELRKDFTPPVYSVDGMAGKEARCAEIRLAFHLTNKWNRLTASLMALCG